MDPKAQEMFFIIFFLFFSKVKDGRSYYPLRPMYDEWDGQNQAVG